MTLEVHLAARAPIEIDVDFTVQAGELLALTGASGAGKSTILRGIAGLWTPERGKVAVNGSIWLDRAAGKNLPTHRRKVGVVFQSYALFPQMSALANVMAAGADRAEAARLLGMTGLVGYEDRRPAELSGGQRQRVAVARALARAPDVLLLDEPFSAVDRATRAGLYQAVQELRAHLDMPVVLVTHDMEEAQRLADRIVVIEQGKVVRAGSTAEVLFDPIAMRGMGLREAGSTLSARISAREQDGLTRLDGPTGPMWIPAIDGAAGTAVRVRIMAHDVILSRHVPDGLSALNTLPCTIEAVMPGDGPGAMVRLLAGDEVLLARITQRSVKAMELAPGQKVYAVVKSMSVARHNIGQD